MWYSHKFKGPGLRYEIAVCIFTSNVAWASGPFPCGRNTDNMIFSTGLKHLIQADEVVVADKGYTDEKCISSIPVDGINPSDIRARHETLNRRLKQFRVLGDRFRHDRNMHHLCFYAVLNVVQLLISTTDPLFNLQRN